MVKTTSQISSLISRIQSAIAPTTISIQPAESFSWNYKSNLVTYSSEHSHFTENLLHEVGHALLGHKDYDSDIELIAIERDAWEKAKDLADKLDISIEESHIEDSLDTYRDWLHNRSTCPNCASTGIEVKKNIYSCFNCHEKWRVNDGRICALRRYKIK